MTDPDPVDILKCDGFDIQMEPSITKWGFEDLEDDPDSHRWRAWWAPGDGGHEVSGIQLRAYPVIKRTPCGVWINTTPQRLPMHHPITGAPVSITREWLPFTESWMGKKLILDGSQQAWAKPTQEAAIRSLAIRLTRWANHVAADIERIQSAATALEQLRPVCSAFAQHARQVTGGADDVVD